MSNCLDLYLDYTGYGLVYCMLLHLNVLCYSSVKQYFTKHNMHELQAFYIVIFGCFYMSTVRVHFVIIREPT